jgi:hypothetical protein
MSRTNQCGLRLLVLKPHCDELLVLVPPLVPAVVQGVNAPIDIVRRSRKCGNFPLLWSLDVLPAPGSPATSTHKPMLSLSVALCPSSKGFEQVYLLVLVRRLVLVLMLVLMGLRWLLHCRFYGG